MASRKGKKRPAGKAAAARQRGSFTPYRRSRFGFHFWRVPLGIVAAAGICAGAVLIISSTINSNSTTSTTSLAREAVPSKFIKSVTPLPELVYKAVGDGTLENVFTPVSNSSSYPGSSSGTTPWLFYAGNEHCTNCALESWSLLVALGRFGTFKKVSAITSGSKGAYGQLDAFSFYGSTYKSDYLTFSPVETASNQTNSKGHYLALQTFNANGKKLIDGLDSAGEPFLDFYNQVVVTNPPTLDAGVLQGLSWGQIISDIHKPQTAQAQEVVGLANFLTAGICGSIKNQDKTVCDAKAISSIESAEHLG